MSGKVYVTPELQAYRKHFGELAVAVRDPEWLASELFSEGMISHEALDDTVTVIRVSCTNKPATSRVDWLTIQSIFSSF